VNKSLWLHIGLIVFFGCALGVTLAQAAPTENPPVPDMLQVPKNQSLLLKAAAKGVQIYTCQANAPNQFAWTLKAPEAALFDEQGQPLGRHYAGPTWESKDGSKVVGQVKAKIDPAQADAIPWLLLEAKSSEGKGIFSQMKWVQRLNTMGGKAPTEGCDSAHLNQEYKVSYTADYYFYGMSSMAPSANKVDY
jgi:Protein of unknown function (DUF3455)